MTKGLQRSLSRGPIRKQIIDERVDLSSFTITVDGASGDGFGSVSVLQISSANVLILASTALGMIFTGPNDAGLQSDWQGDFAFGTTAMVSGNFASTDENLMQPVKIRDTVGFVSPSQRSANLGSLILDGADASVDLFLNLRVRNQDISADGLVFGVAGVLSNFFALL